jgi:hypothetical protein
MKRNIFMTFVLLAFLGCSEKEPEPALKKAVDVNKTTSKEAVSPDFVPEHIKRSRIEVVKHY